MGPKKVRCISGRSGAVNVAESHGLIKEIVNSFKIGA